MGSKCPSNTKTPNVIYPANPTLLSKNNFTTRFKTLENEGGRSLQNF
jgi:hypothetical protein